MLYNPITKLISQELMHNISGEEYFTKVEESIKKYKSTKSAADKHQLYKFISPIIFTQTKRLYDLTGNIYSFDEIFSETVLGVERAIRSYNPRKTTCRNNSGFSVWCKICISSVYGNLCQKRRKNIEKYISIQDLSYRLNIDIDRIPDYADYSEYNTIIEKEHNITVYKIKCRIKQIINNLILTESVKYKTWLGYENYIVRYYLGHITYNEIARVFGIKGNKRKVQHDLSQRFAYLKRRLKKDPVLQSYFNQIKKSNETL